MCSRKDLHARTWGAAPQNWRSPPKGGAGGSGSAGAAGVCRRDPEPRPPGRYSRSSSVRQCCLLNDYFSLPLLTLLLPQLLPFQFLEPPLQRDHTAFDNGDYSNYLFEINILSKGKAIRNENGVGSELKGETELCFQLIITTIIFFISRRTRC